MTDPEPNTVAYLRVHRAELEEKEGWSRPTAAELREILGVGEGQNGEEALDEQGLEVFEEVKGATIISGDVFEDEAEAVSKLGDVCFSRRKRWFAISAQGAIGTSVGDELIGCFDSIKGTQPNSYSR